MHVAATGALTLNGVTLRGGESGFVDVSSFGGGIYNRGGTVTITSTTSAHNVASGGDVSGTNGGGAISPGGGTVTLTNSTVAENAVHSFPDPLGPAGGWPL